jgi:hypothetical protein
MRTLSDTEALDRIHACLTRARVVRRHTGGDRRPCGRHRPAHRPTAPGRSTMSRTPERGREVMAAWATPSTHGAAVYETLLYADGQLSCNCPAWF